MCDDHLGRLKSGLGIDPVVAETQSAGSLNLSYWRRTDERPSQPISYELDAYTISMPLRALDADGWYEGRPVWSGRIREGAMRVTPPGRHRWRSRGSFDLLFFVVSRDCVRQIGGGQADEILDRLAMPLRAADGAGLYLWDRQLASIGRLLGDNLASRSPLDRQVVRGLSHAFVSRALATYGRPCRAARPGGFAAGRLETICDYARSNLAENLSIADLARVAKLSPSRFAHAFRDATGETPHRYLLGLRIGRAERLLLDTAMTVLDVALECGFSDPSHFARVFRKIRGVSPRDFRDRPRNRDADDRNDPHSSFGWDG